jgi:hypothetical protein
MTLFIEPLLDQWPPEANIAAQSEVRYLTPINQTIERAGVTTQIFGQVFDCPDLFATYNREHFYLGCFAPGHCRCPPVAEFLRLLRHAEASTDAQAKSLEAAGAAQLYIGCNLRTPPPAESSAFVSALQAPRLHVINKIQLINSISRPHSATRFNPARHTVRK